MSSRKEETQSKLSDKPTAPPYSPVATPYESLGRLQAEVAELHQRFADADRILHQTQAELHETRQRLRESVAERAKVEATLRETERRFHLMGEAIPFGVWMSDPQGGLEYVSPSFMELTQMTIDELRGFGWTKCLQPEAVETTKRLWEYHARTGQDWEGEHTIRGPDGQQHTVLTRGKALRNEHGEITSWVGIHLDITARKKIEMSLAEHVRKLGRSNSELEQFASVVSHDLRAPLTSIGGCAQLLGELLADKLDSETTELLDNIHESVLHMGRLIKSLLAYARLGKDGLKLRPCSPEKVLADVLVDLRGALAETGAQVNHDPLPVLQADEALLGQLFQNLLENAIKYRGQSPPVVHIGARDMESHWALSVKDNGIGIDPQHFQKIFMIFQRLHSDESRYPGLGVGLATCKKIVEQHGGQIWVESTPGAGSVFHFSLPRQ